MIYIDPFILLSFVIFPCFVTIALYIWYTTQQVMGCLQEINRQIEWMRYEMGMRLPCRPPPLPEEPEPEKEDKVAADNRTFVTVQEAEE